MKSSRWLTTALHAVACVAATASCRERFVGQPDEKPSSKFPADFEGDGVGTDKPGERSSEITAPDGLWMAYDVALGDGSYALTVEGPAQFKRLLVTGSAWPEAFSPDSEFLIYVCEAELSPVRRPYSMCVYHTRSNTEEQLTNTDPALASASQKEFAVRQVGEPLGLLEWDHHRLSYPSRNALGYEQITIDVDTGEVARAPLTTFNPD